MVVEFVTFSVEVENHSYEIHEWMDVQEKVLEILDLEDFVQVTILVVVDHQNHLVVGPFGTFSQRSLEVLINLDLGYDDKQWNNNTFN